MIFDKSRDSALRVLCLGAHSDDIEIGCGGTLLRLAREYPNLLVHWVVFSASHTRAEEARASAANFLERVRDPEVVIEGFKDGYFPYHGGQIKDYFEGLKKSVTPDIVFTHYRDDLHQDHRLINELTWNTYRDHLILEYEIPKYDGDFGVPNFFVPLDQEVARLKLNYLMQIFKSQANKDWFTDETFLSLMRLRGMESRSPSNYAEAFYGRKCVYY